MNKYFLSVFICYSFPLHAQPSLSWQRCSGGTDGEQSVFVVPTYDHGFIITGFTSSTDGDITNNHGGDDALLIRMDSANNILWKKTYGGTLDDDASYILETSDHGFIFVGGTESNDGDVSGNHGDNDLWVVKIDSAGNIQWQKTFGDSTYDAGFSIIQNIAGNYMVLGWHSDANWNADYWLLCLNPSGNIIWQHTYGGSDEDWGYQVIQTLDGGYMLSGFAYSIDGDVTFNHGDRDIWLVKTDSSGTIQWQHAYGGTDDDWADNVIELPNGQFVFAGVATSSDGEVQNSIVGPDYWIVKTDANGNILTQKCYGGSGGDEAYRMIRTADNGIAVTGMSTSNDFDAIGNHGDFDCWTLKLDSNLNKEWALCSGGSDEDLAYGICQMSDGDFVITGYAFSNDGDVSGNHGGGFEDIWTFRLADNGNFIAEQKGLENIALYPNPATDILNVSFFSKGIESGEITVTDLERRELYKEVINTFPGKNIQQVNLNGVVAGAYLLSLRLDNSIAYIRIVKQ